MLIKSSLVQTYLHISIIKSIILISKILEIVIGFIRNLLVSVKRRVT